MEKDKDNVYDKYIKESKLQMQQHQTSDNEDESYSHYVAEATTEEEQLRDTNNQYDFYSNILQQDEENNNISKKVR